METEEHKESYPMHTNNLYPRFSDAEFSHRYANVRAAMQETETPSRILCTSEW